MTHHESLADAIKLRLGWTHYDCMEEQHYAFKPGGKSFNGKLCITCGTTEKYSRATAFGRCIKCSRDRAKIIDAERRKAKKCASTT